FDDAGNAVMVDVGSKANTQRTATARGAVVMLPETLAMIVENKAKKGDVLAVAQLAGIMAAKKTSDLVPLCHPLLLTKVTVDLTPAQPDRVEIEATVKLSGQTGVEMEALTAVSVAALTVYDMCKAVDRGMQITDIRVIHKDGGKSGEFRAE
ncbi:MAG: cyclic pyranopterin monophosphate synthase MoaC, partial [Pseudomonadota bacterium]